jgi:aspartate aminotransferase
MSNSILSIAFCNSPNQKPLKWPVWPANCALGNDVISLSLGEPDFDTPDHIKEAAWQALKDGYTKYTPVAGLAELTKAISDKFKRDNNLEYRPRSSIVSNGAKQTITTCAGTAQSG